MFIANWMKSFIVFGLAVALASCAVSTPRSPDSDPLDLIAERASRTVERDQRGSETIAGETGGAPLQEQIVEGTGVRVDPGRSQGSRLPSGAYSVNFVDARADEAAQTVFGDLLDEPFLIDPVGCDTALRLSDGA